MSPATSSPPLTPGAPATSRPLRPVFITGGLKLGGSTTFLLNLCGEFARRGIPHLVICLEHEHPMREDFVAAGVHFECIDAQPRIVEDSIAWAVSRCRAFRPTHAVGCLGHTSFEVLCYIPPGVPRFGMVQSDDPIVYQALAWYGDVLDATVGVSRKICEHLRETPSLTRVPTQWQPYGIPVSEHLPPPVSESPETPLRILYLGRLGREQKRVHLFPQIHRQLCEAGRPFQWTIAGDGPDAAWLRKALPPSTGVQEIRYSGAVAYRDVPALLAANDIFLLASDYEGLPLSLLEAMAHGLVPVVSDLPSGIREVVDVGTGLLVPPHKTDWYAKAILSLETNRARLATLSAAASQRVRGDFSVKAMADRWHEMFAHYAATKNVEWDTDSPIACPRPLAQKFLFHPVLRPVRRLAKRLLAPPRGISHIS